MPEAVIVSTARSAIGRAHKGSLTKVRPDDLAATIIKAALDHLGFEGGPVRPPFRALDAAEREPVHRLLDQLGFPRVTG